LKVSDELVGGSPNHARTPAHDSPGPDSISKNGGSGSDPAENHAGAAEGTSASGSSGGPIQSLLRFVEELSDSADGLIEVTTDRIRLAVRRRLVRGSIVAGAAVGAAVGLGAAALAILRGVCGGLTALWGGREWLGDLTGGLLAWTLAASAIALHHRLSSRREFRRLKAKYERIRNERGTTHATASPADDGGGVARSRGSAGAPEDRGLGATLG